MNRHPHDPGRGPEFPDPKTMSDSDFYAEWGEIQERYHFFILSDESMRRAADAAALQVLLGLPEGTKRLFDGVSAKVDADWSIAGCAIANRYGDLEKEWLSRESRKVAA